MSLKIFFNSLGIFSHHKYVRCFPIKKLLFLLLFGFILATSITAQSKKIVRFLVLEQGQEPIPGANVLFFKPGDTSFSNYCVTNTDGFCEVRNLTEPKYNIRISYIGFKPHEELIEMPNSEILIKTIELESSSQELDEIFVYGEKEITTGQVGITRISSEDLGKVPSVSVDGDLMSYLQTVPGVITVGDQGGNLYIRGGTPVQNYVLIDNIPMVKPFHISNLFSAFPEQAISSIDIMAGGFDNEFMGGTSAIIDATTKTGNFRDFSSSASFSPYVSTLFYEGPVQENVSSLMINGRLSTIRDFSGYLGTREQDMQFYDIISKYSLQGDNFNCNITAILTGDEGRTSQRREDYLSWTNTGVGLRCFGFDERINHPYEISLGYSKFNNSEGNKFNPERESGVTQMYIRLDSEDYLLRQKIDFGFNFMIQDYSAVIAEKFTGVEFVNAKEPIFQAYVKTEIEVHKTLKVLPSLGSQLTFLHEPTFEPRVRLLWRPSNDDKTEVSFAAGKYYQIMDGLTDQRDAGTAFTIYKPAQNGEPLPSAVHAIIGLKNKLSNKLTTNVEAYYKGHDNIPVSKWNSFATTETEAALANSVSYGADFRIKYQSKTLYMFMGYGWGKVSYEAATDDLGAWVNGEVFEYSPPHDRRHKFSVVGSKDIGKYTFSTSWDVGSGLPYTQVIGFDFYIPVRTRTITESAGIARTFFAEPYGGRLPVYHRLDVSIKRKFDLSQYFKVEAEIGAVNIYDRNNVFYLDLNTTERVDQTPFLPYLSVKASIN